MKNMGANRSEANRSEMRPICRIVYLLIALICMGISMSYGETRFESNFQDSTLRVDLTLGCVNMDGVDRSVVMLNDIMCIPGWSGRRTHVDNSPVAGNGRIMMRSPESGDTLYITTFSTLFQEWLSMAKAGDESPAFENTFLLPMPRDKVEIVVELDGMGREKVAEKRLEFDPDYKNLRMVKSKAGTESRYIHQGKAAHGIDVAILAEGYTEAELPLFFADAELTVNEILKYSPFSENKDAFNFLAVAIPSEESGISNPSAGDWRSTYFGSHFNTLGVERYLTVPRLHAVHDALTGLPYEYVIILANTDKYGGAGIYGSYAIMSAHSDNFLPAVVHEFGHSFGGLADEYFNANAGVYDYPLDVEPWEENITTMVDFGSKWKDMVESGEAGVFEGGAYIAKGVFRGGDECRMRNNTWPDFCPVCRRALCRMIGHLAGTESTEN